MDIPLITSALAMASYFTAISLSRRALDKADEALTRAHVSAVSLSTRCFPLALYCTAEICADLASLVLCDAAYRETANHQQTLKPEFLLSDPGHP